MPYESSVRHRKSIRLPGYDYTQPGSYFVTIVTHRRECAFGEITNGVMRLNEWGKIVAECWSAIPDHYCDVVIDEFIVMPNHIHGIIVICENGAKPAHPVGATQWVAPTKTGSHAEQEIRRGKTTIVSNSIGSMVGQIKSITTKRINQIRNTRGAPVWQRNYWEHIIRNDGELSRIREYIRNNPAQWNTDIENIRHPA